MTQTSPYTTEKQKQERGRVDDQIFDVSSTRDEHEPRKLGAG